MRLARAVGVVISLMALAQGWSAASETWSDLWIRGMAARLEENEIRNDLPPSQDRRWQAAAATSACDSETLYSALAIVLRKTDRTNVSTNNAEWVAGMTGAERFLRHMTACLPTDGNAWLRLAMVTRAIAENPGEICRLISSSRRHAPNEALVLSARLHLYGRLNAKTVDLCRSAIRQDIRTILSHGRKSDFEAVLASAAPPVSDIVRSELADMDEPEIRWARREFPSVVGSESGVRPQLLQ